MTQAEKLERVLENKRTFRNSKLEISNNADSIDVLHSENLKGCILDILSSSLSLSIYLSLNLSISLYLSLNLSLSLRDRDRADTIITFHHHTTTNFLSTLELTYTQV